MLNLDFIMILNFEEIGQDGSKMKSFNIDSDIVLSLEELSQGDLQQLARQYEDPADDMDIELYIYFCLLISKKSCQEQHLEPAIELAKGWIAASPKGHTDRQRRYIILNTVITRHFHLMITSE